MRLCNSGRKAIPVSLLRLLSFFEKGVSYQMTDVFFCDMVVKNIKSETVIFTLILKI